MTKEQIKEKKIMKKEIIEDPIKLIGDPPTWQIVKYRGFGERSISYRQTYNDMQFSIHLSQDGWYIQFFDGSAEGRPLAGFIYNSDDECCKIVEKMIEAARANYAIIDLNNIMDTLEIKPKKILKRNEYAIEPYDETKGRPITFLNKVVGFEDLANPKIIQMDGVYNPDELSMDEKLVEETGRDHKGDLAIIVYSDETIEQAKERYYTQHPDRKPASQEGEKDNEIK